MSESTLDLWHDRMVGFILGATIVILPLILHPAGYDAFRFPKVLVVRTAAVLLLMVYSARFVWLGTGAGRRVLLRDRLVQISAFLIGWCALAAAFSPEPSVSLRAMGDVAAGLILFFGAVSHGRRTGSIRILWLVLIPGVVIVGVVLLQRLDLWHPLVTVAELEQLPRGDRELLAKAALLGNRNDVGLYLLLPLAVAIASSGQRRWTAAAAVLAIMIGIVVTTTLTIIAVGVGLLATQAVRELKELRRRNLIVAGILFVVTLGTLLFAGVQPELKARFAQHTEDLQSLDVIQLARGREASFTVAAVMVKENPLLGVGPGRFPSEFTTVALAARVEVPDLVADPTYFDMVHNDYLEIAAEAGVPALLAAMALVVSYLRRMRGSHGSIAEEFAASAGRLALIAIGAAALVQFPLQLAAVYGTLAIIAGVSLGYVETGQK
ncbi:MAG: O-antigen ligase family protein [Acidobacteria bacterium]|nr:O-antigen ligase family protein [Acidobacteriota bacterium]